MPSPSEFMRHAPAILNANTPWAHQYSMTLRRIVVDHAQNAPRNLQEHLGPSELGSPCDRQVAGKMAGIPNTNHVADPWPSIMGVAGHAWMADCFHAENARLNKARWLPEFRVWPHPFSEHPGTGDLYDSYEEAVVDWKFLGDDSLGKVKKNGPPRRYFVQMLLYGLGFRNIGLPVRRVVLVAWPRTRSTMDNTYVWEHEWTPADDVLLAEVYQQTEARKVLAKGIQAGQLKLRDIPATPSDDECFFCPFLRPEAARDPQAVGCPGHHLLPGRSNITGP
jgi:hypothetical protein